MSVTSPFPEAESAQLEACAVYSPSDISATLRRLRDERALVTVYCDGGPDFAVTGLLDVRRDEHRLVFDYAADGHANRQIGRAQRLVFVGFSGQVKIQFTTGAAVAVQAGGLPAWCAHLPDRLIRLQRREAFRAHLPIGRPALAQWVGEHGRAHQARVADISIGGVRLLLDPAHATPPASGLIERCALALPDTAPLLLDLVVRHVTPARGARAEATWGCEFSRISPGAEMQVQRYIQQLQLEARRLAG